MRYGKGVGYRKQDGHGLGHGKVTKLSKFAILSGLAFGIIATYYLTGNPEFVQGQTHQQQGQSVSPMVQNTSESMQGTTQGNETNQTSSMEIRRAGSQPSIMASDEHFTGNVRVDPLFQAEDPARLDAVSVTFDPGARTDWHSHPLGQLLVVTAGCGLTQVEGSPVEEICADDVVWTPPDVKHWHGASPTTGMTHISFLEHVTARSTSGWNR
jgi:quercetin dioxygenase-like cupin family protein